MASTSESHCSNKREFSRVEAHFPLEIRLVPPDQRRLINSRLGERIFLSSKLPRDVADPLLAEWLQFLNNKLDRIQVMLAANQAEQELPSLRTVSLSGGGVSFISPEGEEYDLGDILELKMSMSSSMPSTLILYGEVVQKEKSETGYFTAVRFLSLDEDIQDKIIKFVFEREREILREKRKG